MAAGTTDWATMELVRRVTHLPLPCYYWSEKSSISRSASEVKALLCRPLAQTSAHASHLHTSSRTKEMNSDITAGEAAVALLTTLFDQYAHTDGDAMTMSRKEFKDMMQKEFPCFQKSECADDKGCDIFQKIDCDGDGLVSFPEFMGLVGTLAFCCHGFMIQANQQCQSQCQQKNKAK
ncbi:S100-P [Solea senegalensis]|uniref:S100-P n=1 Tax=Solea senegalensis TaxID=28829 RepID=A0AAV6PT07_SOLSE|nr:S100-P [Solea senegalensis]